MKLSKGSAYAFHALMYMTRHLTQLPVSTHAIGKAEGIPASYLSKLFLKLGKAGLVRAVSTPRRGYVLGRAPETINLRQIFEAIEGHALFAACPLQHCSCGGSPETCTIYARWHELASGMAGTLEAVSLSQAAWSHPRHRFSEMPTGSA